MSTNKRNPDRRWVNYSDPIERYASSVFDPDDTVEVRCLPSKESLFSRACQLPSLEPELRRRNHAGQNIYVGANPRKHHGGKTADDVVLARTVFADFDGIAPHEALERCNRAGLSEPSQVIFSGHGTHTYWCLAEPITNLDGEWRSYQKQLAIRLGSDPVINDPPRVMRLPGFQNLKPPPAPCEIVSTSPTKIEVSFLRGLLGLPKGCKRETDVTEKQRDREAASDISSVSLLHVAEPAILATLPTGPRQRWTCIFKLCRHLKSTPSLQGVGAKALLPVVQEWHRRASPVIKTKPFSETWIDFLAGWQRVRVPVGQGVIETAFQRAKESLSPPTVVEQFGEGPIALLGSLCRELQRINGEKEFYLDCRTAGRLIGVDHVSAWRYLRAFCEVGILEAGDKGSLATRRSSRFRFVG